MSVAKKLKGLCAPALFYLIVSMISFIMVLAQNLRHTNSLHMGHFSCRVPGTFFVLFLKLMYILFWTWIINLICKDGHTGISWLLVLFPWILIFMVVGLIMMNK